MKRKHVLKMSRNALVLAAVNKLGVATSAQIVAVVAKHIPASQAMRCWERSMRYKHRVRGEPTIRKPRRPLQTGKSAIVLMVLSHLARQGLIKKIKPSVYASRQRTRAEAM